jgi:hypothetical protein
MALRSIAALLPGTPTTAGGAMKMPTKKDGIRFLLLAAASASFAVALLPQIAAGDILELKTGQIVQGKFLGGSPLSIRFQVDGQEQTFSTKDVLNIGFNETSDASTAATAVPPPDASAGAAPASPESIAPAPPPAPLAPAVAPVPAPPPAPYAPPPPVTAPTFSAGQNSAGSPVTALPAGTSLLVLMVDGVDSSKNKVGDSFYATLESALVVGDTVVAADGADVCGKLTQEREPGETLGRS